MKFQPLLFAFAAGICAPLVSWAQVDDIASPPQIIRADYVSCLYAAQNDPAFGLEKAQSWIEELRADLQSDPAHGFFAEHCFANALYLAERFGEAGQLLERLAELRLVTQDEAKADLLIQSGQAYFRDEDYVKAIEVQRRASSYRPWSPDIHIDLAYSREALGDNLGVVADLELAKSLDPDRADIRVLLASAKRAIQDYPAALQELDQVILRWAGHPEALLERGITKRVQGNILGAEADWLLVLRLHPNSPAAGVALQNLNNL